MSEPKPAYFTEKYLVGDMPVAGTQWEDAKEVATQVTVQSVPVAPVGLKALGFGLLGAALTMAAVESVQMLHLFSKNKVWRKGVGRHRGCRLRSCSTEPTSSSKAQMLVLQPVTEVSSLDTEIMTDPQLISIPGSATVEVSTEDKNIQTTDPCTVTTASVETEPMEALVSKSIQCSPSPSPDMSSPSPDPCKVTDLGSSMPPSRMTTYDENIDSGIKLDEAKATWHSTAVTTAATRDELLSVESCGSTTIAVCTTRGSGFHSNSRLCASSMYGDEDGVTDAEEVSSGCILTSSAIGAMSELPDWLPTPRTSHTPSTGFGGQVEVVQRRYECTKCHTVLKTFSSTSSSSGRKGNKIQCCVASCSGTAKEVTELISTQEKSIPMMPPSMKSSSTEPREYFKPLKSSSGEDDVFVSFDNLPSWGEMSKGSVKTSGLQSCTLPGSKSVRVIKVSSLSSPVDEVWAKQTGEEVRMNTRNYEDAWQRYQNSPRVKFDLTSLSNTKPDDWKEKDDTLQFSDYDRTFSGKTPITNTETVPPVGPQAFATIVFSPSEVSRASKLCVSLRNVCPDCGVVILMLPQLEPVDMALLKNSSDILIQVGPNNASFARNVPSLAQAVPFLWKFTFLQKIVFIPPWYELTRELATKVHALFNIDKPTMLCESLPSNRSYSSRSCYGLDSGLRTHRLIALVLTPARPVYERLKGELKVLPQDFDSELDSLKYMLVRTMPNMKITTVEPQRIGVRRVASSTSYSPITYTSHHMVAH